MTTEINTSKPVTGMPRDDAPQVSAATRQYISFRIDKEEYAVDIMSVREIKGWAETTALPNQPDYVLGVLNLRGTIVPIFDLRRRFGQGLTNATRTHVIIIAMVQERMIGLLVDAVSDIVTVHREAIRPVPEMDRNAGAEYLAGIIDVDESMAIILSLEVLFGRRTSTGQEGLAA